MVMLGGWSTKENRHYEPQGVLVLNRSESGDAKKAINDA
jgi:hypothetical protein